MELYTVNAPYRVSKDGTCTFSILYIVEGDKVAGELLPCRLFWVGLPKFKLKHKDNKLQPIEGEAQTNITSVHNFAVVEVQALYKNGEYVLNPQDRIWQQLIALDEHAAAQLQSIFNIRLEVNLQLKNLHEQRLRMQRSVENIVWIVLAIALLLTALKLLAAASPLLFLLMVSLVVGVGISYYGRAKPKPDKT